VDGDGLADALFGSDAEGKAFLYSGAFPSPAPSPARTLSESEIGFGSSVY
jgi:hypothetical protein